MQRELEGEYRVLPKRTKALRKRRYRGPDPKVTLPAEHELALRADFELFKKMREKKAAKASTPAPEPQQSQPAPKPVPEIRTSFTEEERHEPDIVLPAVQAPVVAPPQIVELESKEAAKFSVNRTKDEIRVEMELPKISSISELDLLVSDKCVKISSKQYRASQNRNRYEDVNIALDAPINRNAVRARFIKKKKVLSVKLAILKP